MAPPQMLAAAKPVFGARFDAWNSSATGHQRAENKLAGSTGWRESRATKLRHQFKSGGTGDKRISDRVGAGSEDWDEKAKALIPKEVKARARQSVSDMLVGKPGLPMSAEERLMEKRRLEDETKVEEEDLAQKSRGIFDELVIYINGSTYPMVSDHKLKHLLAENGARMSMHLGRRQVTHIILGKPSHVGSGAGGGLAGGKLEKEIRRIGGCGVKYVGVEWVLESIKAGKRLPETRFSNLKVAPKSQQSVYGMFKKTAKRGLANGPKDID
ncbi:83eb6286-febd-4979-aea5-cad02acdcf12 [Sclerotinia trifoliorum]|uniref:83eb6286-febd-4979-aea5-cad02acdcf12 n=1 Tax=Sclerotinia trifoliorum TaxID=28548 RepID=A0A8H2W3I6_9HELO|nr:83eb6286-febd-4979-aea5-cad02acdcf12 [Sclerotinia trifoliorum]